MKYLIGSDIKTSKVIDLLIVIFVVALVMFLGSAFGEALRIFANPLIIRIDPNDYFLISSFTFFCSLLFTLAIMKIMSRQSLSYWGFNLRQAKFSIKTFLIFCLIYTPIIFFTKVIEDSKETIAANKSIDIIEIVGSIVNHLLISGIYQEALFRGFIMVFLSRSWPGEWAIGKIKIPHTALLATLIFVLAHVRWGQYPLFLGWQVAWTLILGLYYALMFYKTKSLLNPILSHSYSNTIYVVLLILYSMFGWSQ